MSLTRTTTLRCDGDDSGTWCEEEVYIQTSAAENDVAKVRAKAKAVGWQLTRERFDLCPTHRT